MRASAGDIAFFGDPHGDFSQVARSLRPAPPDAAVFLGDFDLDRPLHDELAPLATAGASVWYIHGNHDTDREHWHDHLFDSKLGSNNLSGRVVEVSGIRMAGLGGVFRQKIWHPKSGSGEPLYRTRKDFLRANPRSTWRSGLPRGHRSTIFPEDLDALADLRADVLVSHEAPSCHRYGFAEIDLVAEAMGVKAIVHGHHHERYTAVLSSGVDVLGLGKADLVRVPADWMAEAGWVSRLDDSDLKIGMARRA